MRIKLEECFFKLKKSYWGYIVKMLNIKLKC